MLGEAALTGLIASALGLGLGVAAAIGLKALLKAFGIVLPSSPLVFEARTAIVAIAVGVGVTGAVRDHCRRGARSGLRLRRGAGRTATNSSRDR